MAEAANQGVGFQVARTLPHTKALIKKESDIITKTTQITKQRTLQKIVCRHMSRWKNSCQIGKMFKLGANLIAHKSFWKNTKWTS